MERGFNWTSATVLVCIVLAREVISVHLVRKYHYVPCHSVFIVFWGTNLRPYCTELNLNSMYYYIKRYSPIQIRLSSVSDVTSRASGSPSYSAEQNSFFTSSMCYAEKVFRPVKHSLYWWTSSCRKLNILSSQEVCTKKFLGPHTERVLSRQDFLALALNEEVLQSSGIMFLEIDFDIVKFVHRVGWTKFSTGILILALLDISSAWILCT